MDVIGSYAIFGACKQTLWVKLKAFHSFESIHFGMKINNRLTMHDIYMRTF